MILVKTNTSEVEQICGKNLKVDDSWLVLW